MKPTRNANDAIKQTRKDLDMDGFGEDQRSFEYYLGWLYYVSSTVSGTMPHFVDKEDAPRWLKNNPDREMGFEDATGFYEES
jgi:hypothetical protein